MLPFAEQAKVGLSVAGAFVTKWLRSLLAANGQPSLADKVQHAFGDSFNTLCVMLPSTLPYASPSVYFLASIQVLVRVYFSTGWENYINLVFMYIYTDTGDQALRAQLQERSSAFLHPRGWPGRD